MTRYPRSNTEDTLLGIKSGTYLNLLQGEISDKNLPQSVEFDGHPKHR